MQKRVLEVLKTWYFPYSAFWSAGQWGGYSLPAPPWLRYCLEVSQQSVTQKVFPSVVLAQRRACFLKIKEKVS